MRTPAERYRDILPDGPDADALRAIGDLEAVYTPRMSPPPPLAAAMDRAIRARIQEVERPSPVWPVVKRPSLRAWPRRPSAIAAALFAALTIVGVVYAAAVTLGDQALLENPGTRQIAVAHLGRSLDLSQRACGFTVTLNRVYVDIQRIVIAYTVVGPDGRTFQGGTLGDIRHVEPALTSASGAHFQGGGINVTGGGINVTGGLPDVVMGHSEGQILSFSARTVWVRGVPRPYHPGPGPLALRLTLPAIQLIETGSGPWPATPACEAHDTTTRDQATGVRYRGVAVAGPFIYAFTAPVALARTIAVHEVRRVGTTTLMLTGVEITPSNVRVFLHARGGAASGWPNGDTLFPAFLTLPQGSTGGCPALSRVTSAGRPACRGQLAHAGHILAPNRVSYPYTLDIPVAAYSAHGAATLVVYTRLIKLHDKRTATSTGYTESFTARYVDPLTFHLMLTVPPGRAVDRPHLP